MKETSLKANSRQAIKYRGVECLNCGHPLDLSDRFCAYCGQINTTKRLSIGDFFGEFVLSVFTYDSRFRFTIKDLLFKPGTITRNYVEGKRLKYANPFRFFLSASIFYFILLAFISLFEEPADVQWENGAFIVNNGSEEVVNLQETLGEIDFKKAQNYNDQQADSLAQTIEKKFNAGIASLSVKKNAKAEEKAFKFISEDSLKIEHGSGISLFANKGKYFYEFSKDSKISNPGIALDSLNYEKTRTNIFLYSKTNDIKRIEENPAKFLSYLSSKTPFFLFFFAPIFAIIFWIIYSKKKFNYMEHLVFIFHIFSWIFIVLLICLLPDLFIPGNNMLAAVIILLIGPFYFYKALRNFYKQKRRWTIPKFVFLNIVFLIGATTFAVIFFAITAFLF